MVTDNLSTLPFADMLDLLPDGVVCHEAVRNEVQTIIDFRLIYYNKAFELFAPAPYKRDLGLYMLADNPGQEAILAPAMQQYVRVVETGETANHVFFDPNLQATVSLRARKLGDGVLVTLRDVTVQQLAARQAEAHHNLLQGILNTSLNGTVVYEAIRDDRRKIIDFRFRLYNQIARESIIARIGKDIADSTLLSVYPDSHETGMFDLYVQVTETGQPIRTEHLYPQIDTWYDVSLTKLDDGCVVTFIDISQSKRMAKRAEEQASFVNSILDGSLNSIMAYESIRGNDGQIADFRVVLANHAAETYLQHKANELPGQSLLALYPEEYDMDLFGRYVETVETGQPFRAEANYYNAGVESWLDLSVTKLGDGFVVTFTDISNLKRAAHEIEQQAEFVRKLLDGSLNGLVSLDPIRNYTDGAAYGKLIDLRILSANRAVETFLRRSEAKIVGRSLLQLYPECVKMGVFAMFERVLETKQAERMEAYLKTGKLELWIDVFATPRDSYGLVVSFLDITERKKAQRHTDSLVQELQKSNANLEQFAYIASHDLQEPLRKVVGFSDMLYNQYADRLGADGADMIHRMQSAAIRMQTLIKDILTYSHVANTKKTFNLVDLNQVVREVLNDLELSIKNKKAEITIGPLPTVTGDALQLHQLFQNLFSNGLKFQREGLIPHLQVSADFVHGHEVIRSYGSNLLPESLANQEFHRIQVSDNGIGFEPQYAEQIFQVFQRLHTRSQYSGTGIGLSIVQKVVENHRGLINAEGRPNKGATFIILLPNQAL